MSTGSAVIHPAGTVWRAMDMRLRASRAIALRVTLLLITDVLGIAPRQDCCRSPGEPWRAQTAGEHRPMSIHVSAPTVLIAVYAEPASSAVAGTSASVARPAARPPVPVPVSTAGARKAAPTTQASTTNMAGRRPT